MVAADPAALGVAAGSPPAKRPRVEDLPDLELRSYEPLRILGQGSFGKVYQCRVAETGDIVAIKSVNVIGLTETSFKHPDGKLDGSLDREVQILKELDGHDNIVALKGVFLSGIGKTARLNLVLEFMSDTLQRVIKHYNQLSKTMDLYYVRLYQYQLLRALAFMHGKGFMHVDIKPQNLLLDGGSHTLKICDFGTAKRVHFGKPHVIAYACSRYYRAPELILGMMEYTTTVDIWSAGCVFAEMMLGQPLFTGLQHGIDQFIEIVKVLGTPSAKDLRAMNPNYPMYDFTPKLDPIPWDKVLRGLAPREAVDLVAGLIGYDPATRLPPWQALLHRFFDALRNDERPEHKHLFTFAQGELDWCNQKEKERLIPRWIQRVKVERN